MLRKNLANIIVLALVAVTVFSAVLFTSHSSKAATTVSAAPVSYDGTWTGATQKGSGDLDGLNVIAKIHDQIVFNFHSPEADVDLLFWAGTFPANTGSTIVSVADHKVMDKSIFASEDATKTFIYKDGTLQLKLMVDKTGESQILSLKKAS